MSASPSPEASPQELPMKQASVKSTSFLLDEEDEESQDQKIASSSPNPNLSLKESGTLSRIPTQIPEDDIESQAVTCDSNPNLSEKESPSPMPTEDEAVDETSKGRRLRCGKGRRFSRPSRRCSVCLLLSFVVSVVAAALLWPRTVDWEVKEINLDDDDLYGLISAMTNPAFSGTETFELDAVVQATNPNMVGAKAGSGTFVVTHGPFTLAIAKTEPLVVHRQEVSTIKAHSVTEMTPESSQYMMKILPPLKYMLTVDVVGEVPATVGVMELTVHVNCKVDVDVMKIMTDRTKLVAGHKCKYGISL